MSHFDHLMKHLESVDFFKGFSASEKEYVRDQGLFETHEDGAMIIQEGEEDRTFYVLITGTVKVTKNSLPDQTLAELKAGSVFGEIAHFSRQVRSTNVIAVGPVLVFKLVHDLFRQLKPEVREKINHQTMAVLMSRLESLKRSIAS